MIPSQHDERTAPGAASPAWNASFTIDEWCAHRKVSRPMFYKLDAQGKAPKTHNAGRKRLISPTADADWLAETESEAA